ncbi:MAG: prephenate dehydrogenase/arogenate dehydrogenase family protein [Candidatus Eremiobacteraeota bacterium]|nr:prephenate dehydrogenase/arogenate dehydrogenase family protein [Candidatus Eremiobacteraeota bacterium]
MSAAGRSRAAVRSRVVIVGTGLIGTSLALALRRRAPRIHITGFDAKRAHADAARRRGALDAIANSLDSAVAQGGLIVFATPLQALVRQLPRSIERAPSGSFLIDVGPLFAPLAAAVRAPLARRRGAVELVLGHPLAGRELRGPRAADAALFEGRPFALFAPPQPRRAHAWRTAEAIARRIGARPVRLDPAQHDRLIASMSAMPQLASVAVALAAGRGQRKSMPTLAGPGFDSATRLADSPFSIWSAAIAQNAGNAARALAALERAARRLRSALQSGNLAKIEADFRAAAAVRRRILRPGTRSAATRNSSGRSTAR